jgi:hypothetical protein
MHFSLEDFRHSGDRDIWAWANEKFGCFKRDLEQSFYRNLLGLRIPNPDFGTENPQRTILFSDYYEKQTGIEYGMGNAPVRPEVDAVLDLVFGFGSAEKLRSSLDQVPMQFFVSHFILKLQELYPDNRLSLKKSQEISIFKDERGQLFLRAVYDIDRAEDRSINPPLEIPFKVKVDSTFVVLEKGVQFTGLELTGEEAQLESVKRLLLEDIKQFSLLDRLHYTAPASPNLESLMNLAIMSPQAAIGLCQAVEMGARLPEFVTLTGESEKNMYKFLKTLGEFVLGGRLDCLLEPEAGNLMERRGLRDKMQEIEANFRSRLESMKTLTLEEEEESDRDSFSDSESDGDDDDETVGPRVKNVESESPMLSRRPPGGDDSPASLRPRRLRLTSSPTPVSSDGLGAVESKGPGREEAGQKPGEF